MSCAWANVENYVEKHTRYMKYRCVQNMRQKLLSTAVFACKSKTKKCCCCVEYVWTNMCVCVSSSISRSMCACVFFCATDRYTCCVCTCAFRQTKWKSWACRTFVIVFFFSLSLPYGTFKHSVCNLNFSLASFYLHNDFVMIKKWATEWWILCTENQFNYDPEFDAY